MQIQYTTSWADVIAKINQKLGYNNANISAGSLGLDSQFGVVAVSVRDNVEYCVIYPTRQTGGTLNATVFGDKITPEVVADVQRALTGR